MDFEFKDGRILKTDYFQSAAWARGLAWLVVHDHLWHVLVPGPPRSHRCFQAGPVEDPDEEGGWSWCLDVDRKLFFLPAAQIHGRRPDLPAKGTVCKRRIMLYTDEVHGADRAHFGSIHGICSGLRCDSYDLWLTHGVHVTQWTHVEPPAPARRRWRG